MKIDIHTHILPEKWPNLSQKYGYKGEWLEIKHEAGGVASLYKDSGEFFRKVDMNCWNLEARIKEMNKTQVDIQVLSTVPAMFNYWAKPEDTLDLCRILNDDIANSVAKYPNRFAGLGSIPLQDPILSIEELKRVKSLPGLYGIQIGTHIADHDFDDQMFDPIFKTCEELQIPIFVHPWNMTHTQRYQKFWLPWLVGMPTETTMAIVSMLMGGVLLKYPRLKICFAHGGGTYPYTRGRIEHGHLVRPDLCATKCSQSPLAFKGKFYTDSLVHDPECLDFLTSVIGSDKVCLGSDYPFPLGEHDPGKVVNSSSLSFSDKNKILWKNTAEFLSLPSHYFETSDI